MNSYGGYNGGVSSGVYIVYFEDYMRYPSTMSGVIVEV